MLNSMKVDKVNKKFEITNKLPKKESTDERSEKAENKSEEKDNVLSINTNPDLRPYTPKRAYEDYVLVEEDNVVESRKEKNE